MRYLFGFLCVCALGVVPLVGCGDQTTINIYVGTGGVSGNGGDGGGCEMDVCPCTEQGIRDAIAKGGGPYTFTCEGPTTVVTEAEITINNDVILDGGGNLTVGGSGAHRAFSVPEDATVELRGLVVTGGATSEAGGGILNQGKLTLTDTTVSGNTAGGNGGGIDNHGVLTLKGSTVSRNSGQSGGGIYVGHSGMLMVTNSTLSGNTTETCGGAIDVDGVVTLTNSTISGNTANNCGGGLFSQGTLALASSIVSGNSDNDCDGDITSNGYNIESPGNTCGFDQVTDQVDVTTAELNLGLLADNGGPTQTHAITPDSAAFNAGTCEVDEDQRGMTRPQGPACDVGAFELEQ